jgi:hypothetical protein
MHRLLWGLQMVLALAFVAHGLMVLFPPAAVAEQMNAFLPGWFQIFLGGAEVAAAVGLTFPGWTGIRPALVSWAAAGLIPIMIGATVIHLQRQETGSAVVTALLLVMAATVAYLRWRVYPIAGPVGARRIVA